MARARNIKPGFFLNDELAELVPLARLLFAGLWCIADREGRLEDKPKRIKAEVLPYDDCNVDELLQMLYEKSFIIRYEIDGAKYIEIVNFKKHQNPHIKEAASIIPTPNNKISESNKHSTSTVQKQIKHSENPADSLNPHTDSLNPHIDSLSHAPVGDGEYIETPAEKPEEKSKSGAQNKDSGKGEYTSEFEKFWGEYPRRIEKKTAFRAWKARINEKIPVQIMILAAKNYAIYCSQQHTEQRFIKHAATFIGPDKPFEEYIKEPAAQIANSKSNTQGLKSINTLQTLYAQYEKEERLSEEVGNG